MPVAPTHQVAAAVLVRDHGGRMLMVRTDYREGLVLPGGVVVEFGESPLAAAERELREETGLVVEATRMLVVEHLRRGEGLTGLRFIFDAPRISADVPLTPQEGEVAELLWLEPDAAVARHEASGRRRVAAAIEAAASGTTVYLDG